MRVACATCAAIPDGRADDHDAARLLGADFRIWTDETIDRYAYDRVVIRSLGTTAGNSTSFWLGLARSAPPDFGSEERPRSFSSAARSRTS
jgi:hypothetical protein